MRRDVRDRLNHLKDARQMSLNELLTAALDRLEEADFWRRQREAHAAVLADPELRERAEAERSIWDGVVTDGLDLVDDDERTP
ncbi:hypothetical protein [Aquipuribacter nitratireducens]|uniref:Toxin-antitoxin system protein n=1 Tax=Aquipuribacter nitratireducens TaxID=650104 RepID=A0ABW0GHZ1_9MICO